jgi:hypothetical protein
MLKIKKYWALYLSIILLSWLSWTIVTDFKNDYMTYRMLQVNFSPSWQEGKLGRISLAKFILVKENKNIWTIKSGGKTFDIDVNKRRYMCQ